ncbi:MAG: hypothetical protein DRJ10_12665 [Bacteroidetes bacterium]|nr:MAG: hypothetical protein DRJ10_12665 [Bacteroidota bacterium]
MKQRFIFILFFVIVSSIIYGQDTGEIIKGKVSFVTSKNIYVKFSSTKSINIGDTLRISNKTSPCLIVKNKSSISCVCSKIGDCDIKKDDEVIFKNSNNIVEKIKEEKKTSDDVKSLAEIEDEKIKESIYKQKIKGRISVSSYSNLSGVRDDKHRIMYRFSLNANHINNSKFSIESYLNYSQYIYSGESKPTKENLFRVYNLALKYNIDPSFSVVIGRKINNKISSVGAIDGLQVEKYFGAYYIGLISGFRPDIFDYSFNSDLFEYGAYIGWKSDNKNLYSQTTMGLLEQRNGSEIDRRYTYFQHSSTIMKKLNIFSSIELDIYSKVNGIESNDIRLTNFYLSASYRFTRKFDLTLSYDSRKRIFYYETYQTEIEKLLNDDIARQGLRARLNIKPIKHVNTGLSYSKRFQSDELNKSDNINGYISLSKIPIIEGRFSINVNYNLSNYLESKILSLRHSRTLIKKKLYADLYFRMANYNYLDRNLTREQNYYGANLSYNISRKLMFSIFGELSNSKLEENYRINIKIIKRFNSQRKK